MWLIQVEYSDPKYKVVLSKEQKKIWASNWFRWNWIMAEGFDVGLPGDERASSWPSVAVAQLAESVKVGRLLQSVGVHSL